jgi:hypothetical protein
MYTHTRIHAHKYGNMHKHTYMHPLTMSLVGRGDGGGSPARTVECAQVGTPLGAHAREEEKCVAHEERVVDAADDGVRHAVHSAHIRRRVALALRCRPPQAMRHNQPLPPPQAKPT